MRNRILVSMLVMITLCVYGISAYASVAEKLTITPVFQAKKEIVIPVTQKPGQEVIEFPAVAKEQGMILCARFRVSLPMKEPGGWDYYFAPQLNDKAMGERLSNGSMRLINRGSFCKLTTEGNRSWWGGKNNDALQTFFGPANGPLDSRLISSRGEGYWYVLNISDIANYLEIGADNRIESAVPNKLVLRNNYIHKQPDEKSPCNEMRISDFAIGYVPAQQVAKLAPITTVSMPKLKGRVVRSGSAQLTLASSGAMELQIGKDRTLFRSAFSYPSTAMGFHNMSWEKSADNDWKVRAEAGKAIGECSTYKVVRSVREDKGKFRVTDTIINMTNQPLGLSVRNTLQIANQIGKGNSYLAGQKDCRNDDACPTNPSIFLKRSASSVGVLVEDDVFRCQLAMMSTDYLFQFRTDNLGIAPNAKYSLEWTIYPSKDRDYYSFVSRVRKDWNVNFTIQGSFAFAGGEVIPERKIKLYAVAPWFEYADGAGKGWDWFKETLTPKVATIHKAQPDAITLAMIETNLIAQNTHDIPGSEILPDEKIPAGGRGTYGLALNAQQSKILDSSPWADSMLRTDEGNAIIDTYYAWAPYIDLMVYPVAGNYQEKYMIKQVDYALDQVGFRGIYFDQFTLAGGLLKNPDRRDFHKWDEHTVDLNERGEIIRKYTDVSLAGRSARKNIIKHILSKGATVVVNGHCPDKETRSLPFIRFAESEWVDWDPIQNLNNEPPAMDAMAEAHLDTPVHLGIRPDRFGEAGNDHWAEIIHKWVVAGLKNGGLYYYYASEIPKTGRGAGEYGEINHMFPFTPVELHEGWLIGKERTITAKSGTFTWSRPDKPVCLVFNLKGLPVPANAVMTRKGKVWNVKIKINDWNEVAVIEAANEH